MRQVTSLFHPRDKIALRYFPGVTGRVSHHDAQGRVWVKLDKDVLDSKAGVPTPVAEAEMVHLSTVYRG